MDAGHTTATGHIHLHRLECAGVWLRHGLETFAKLYTTKQPINAADLLNDRVLPFFEEVGLRVLRILTDQGTEYCGRADRHDYELYLALNDIEHTKTKAKSPQTNEICERFHKTILDEFYRVAFRKKIYRSLEELQEDVDHWMERYNNERVHQGKRWQGRTPMETFRENIELAKEKIWAMMKKGNLTAAA